MNSTFLRALVTAANDDGTYNVLLSGSDDPMLNVPAIGYADVPVGSNVTIDVSDPQTPQILAHADSGVRWIGQVSTGTVSDTNTMLKYGWHYPRGTWYSYYPYIEPVHATSLDTTWTLPNAEIAPHDAVSSAGPTMLRTAAWYDGNNNQKQAIITHGGSDSNYVAPGTLIAWDARNSYALQENLPEASPSNRIDVAQTVTATKHSDMDKGLILIISGSYAAGYFEGITGTLDPSTLTQATVVLGDAASSTSSAVFNCIAKIECVRPQIDPETQVVTAVPSYASGPIDITYGSISFTIPQGDSLYLVNREEITLTATAGSGDPYEVLVEGNYVFIDGACAEVRGVVWKTDDPVFNENTVTARLVINGRGLLGGTPKAQSAGTPVRVAHWVASINQGVQFSNKPSSNAGLLYGDGITQCTIAYDRLFVVQERSNANLLWAIDVKTGKRAWATQIPDRGNGQDIIATICCVDEVQQTLLNDPYRPALVVTCSVDKINQNVITKWCAFRVSDGSVVYANDETDYPQTGARLLRCLPSSGTLFLIWRTIDQQGMEVYHSFTRDLREWSTLGNTIYSPPWYPVSVTNIGVSAPLYLLGDDKQSIDMYYVGVKIEDVAEAYDTAVPDKKYTTYLYRLNVAKDASVTTLQETSISMPAPLGPSGFSSISSAGSFLGYSDDGGIPRIYLALTERFVRETIVYHFEENNTDLKGRCSGDLGTRVLSVYPSTGSVLGVSSNYIDVPSPTQTNEWMGKLFAEYTPLVGENPRYNEIDMSWSDLAAYVYRSPIAFFFAGVSMVPGDGFLLRTWNSQAQNVSSVGLNTDFASEMFYLDEPSMTIRTRSTLAVVSWRGSMLIGRFRYTDGSTDMTTPLVDVTEA